MYIAVNTVTRNFPRITKIYYNEVMRAFIYLLHTFQIGSVRKRSWSHAENLIHVRFNLEIIRKLNVSTYTCRKDDKKCNNIITYVYVVHICMSMEKMIRNVCVFIRNIISRLLSNVTSKLSNIDRKLFFYFYYNVKRYKQQINY